MQSSLPFMPSDKEHLDVPTLETWLWDAACAIRGAADAPKFKDFILPLVFFKRLSDVFDDEFAAQIKDVLETPTLIPEDKEAIVYCTCPGEKTSRAILRRALRMRFSRIKFLKGGLEAWKAKGYPVEPYETFFVFTHRVSPSLELHRCPHSV